MIDSNSDIYKVIADESLVGIFLYCSENQKIIYCNQLAKEILELDPKVKVDDIQINDFLPARTRPEFRSFSLELLQLDGLMRDILMQKASGIPLVVDLGIRNIDIDGKPHVMMMIQDVTVQKKLQREINMKQAEIQEAFEEAIQQNKQLKELDLAKDRFIALTTHELRTPVAAIYATAEVLKLGFYDTDEQRDEFIGTVFEQAGAILELVNDILDFAKIQAGKMDFFIEELDLRETLDLHVTNFQQMATQKEVTVAYNPPEAPLNCYFDSIRLGEVISNVMSNAVKFTREKSEVTVSVENKDQKYILKIADQGEGIPDDKVDKVFNEFETVGNIKTHQKGTGLGMPISKKIMDTMGGSISLESVVGAGTTFHIEIPCEKVLDEDQYQDRPEQVDDLLATV